MKRLISILAFFLFLGQTNAQTQDSSGNEMTFRIRQPHDTSKKPLIVIGGQLVSEKAFSSKAQLINIDNIESINVHRNDEISKSYAAKGDDGVVVIKLKSKVKWLTLREFLAKNGMTLPGQSIRLFANGEELKDFEEMLIDPTMITGFELIEPESLNGKKEKKQVYLKIKEGKNGM